MEIMIQGSTLEVLRAGLRGTAYAAGEDGYDEASRAWNLNAHQEPALVVMAEGAVDVMAAVRFALRAPIYTYATEDLIGRAAEISNETGAIVYDTLFLALVEPACQVPDGVEAEGLGVYVPVLYLDRSAASHLGATLLLGATQAARAPEPTPAKATVPAARRTNSRRVMLRPRPAARRRRSTSNPERLDPSSTMSSRPRFLREA